MGDFNGDGYTDIAVYRPSGINDWYIKLSTASGIGAGAQTTGDFGLSSDTPMTGDLNGDGRTDGIIIRPSGTDMTWLVGFADATGKIDYNTGGGISNWATFGLTTDTPMIADINGDGRDDIGYIRNAGSGLIWRFALTTSQGGLTAFPAASAEFGSAGDSPLIGQLDYAIPGDVNDDLKVNLLDFAQFSAAWLSQTDQPHWDKECDIDLPENGIINIQDLAVMIENWLAGN
ncbi:MAG: hypothetical protein KAH12_03465 [Anaerolineales bacterium]|nr:hypothetical protein [Anaerolineales bacterium]